MIVLLAFSLGVLLTIVAAFSFHDFLKRHADIKLKTDNEYLTKEVKRLREFMAQHVGTKPGRPEDDQEDLSIAA